MRTVKQIHQSILDRKEKSIYDTDEKDIEEIAKTYAKEALEAYREEVIEEGRAWAEKNKAEGFFGFLIKLDRDSITNIDLNQFLL